MENDKKIEIQKEKHGKFFPYSFVNQPHHVQKFEKCFSSQTIVLWFPCKIMYNRPERYNVTTAENKDAWKKRTQKNERVVHFKYSLVVLIGHKMVTLWPLPADTMSGKILYI